MQANKPGTLGIVSHYSNSGQLLYQQDYRAAKRSEYVYLGGSLVAAQETPHGTSATAVKYQHTDALGSPIAETDANKTIVRKSEYEPYGLLANRPLTDGPGFTGHVQDAATGLTYMQQRYYDPTVGRFLSVDPVTALSNPVGMFNRYKYAANNPYRFVDPDGRKDKVTGSNIPGNSVAMARITTTASGVGTGENKHVRESTEKWSAASGPPISTTVDVPSQDRYALGILLGESVDEVQVLENSPFAKLHGAIATTRENAIYLSIGGEAFLKDPQLVLEEYYHVIKQWNTGDLTLEKYITENATNGDGYRGNRYEVEAKGFAEENWRQFQYMRGK